MDREPSGLKLVPKIREGKKRKRNSCLAISIFQNEEIFVQLDGLDKLDRISHA